VMNEEHFAVLNDKDRNGEINPFVDMGHSG
jgi:hypothetical protein